MSDRPGIMVYFDVIPSLEILNDAEAGRLFKAALVYGSTGEVPSFEDRTMLLAWCGMKSAIDRDGERYSEKKLRNRYNRYCGIEKSNGREPLDYEDWLTTVDDRQRTSPTTTTAPTTAPSITPAAAATASPPTNATEGGAGGNRKASSRNEHIDGADLSEAYTSPSISDHLFPSTPPPKEKEFDDLKVERMAMLSDHIAKQRRTG